MRKFWYGGHCSTEFGLMASGSGTFNSPERDVEKKSVPGRNGDLIYDNGRFKNVRVPYPVSICKDFAENASGARAWLLSGLGVYLRLEDLYNPDSFRMAAFVGPVDFDMHYLNKAGEAVLYFDCKPQRFLKLGEQAVEFTTPGVLRNPTLFPAKPIIMIYGTGAGTVTVGDQTVIVKSIEDQITLDCDLQHAYRQVGEGATENMNTNISAPEFPQLLPGENTVSWTGDIERVEIIPRWWTV